MITMKAPPGAWRMIFSPNSEDEDGMLSFTINACYTDEFVTWCEQIGISLPTNLRVTEVDGDDNRYTYDAEFDFESDEDAVMFRLRWDKPF